MPEQTLEQQQAENVITQQQTPTTTTLTGPGLPPPPVLQIPGVTTGPPPPQVPLVLRGRSRFEAEVNANKSMFMGGIWSADFNRWVLSLKEDLSDPEYSAVLGWAKTEARKKQEEIERGVAGVTPVEGFKVAEAMAGTLPAPGQGLPTPETMAGAAVPVAGPGLRFPENPPGSPNVTIPATPGAPAKPGEPAKPGVKSDEQLQREQQTKLARAKRFESQTMFKGGPTDPFDDRTPAEMEEEFIRNNGETHEGAGADYRKRSGAYVYVGTETDPETGAVRDVYVYAGDATAGLYALGPSEIKRYQAMTGAPQTGVPGPEDQLQAVWDYAVKTAQGYAQAGIKMSVREIFDNEMRNRQRAYANRGGGGGGGGLGGLEEDPEDRAAVDYYRAMMQVLGDISGVVS